MKKKPSPKSDPKDNKVADLKQQLARALADYDNLRKRTQRESEEQYMLASAKVAVRLLPVFDMLEEAQGHLSDSGLAIAVAGFEDALKSEGIERLVVKKGDKFDEQLHEAVEVVEGAKSGVIVNVEHSGWKLIDGPVIRHVKVKVGKK